MAGPLAAGAASSVLKFALSGPGIATIGATVLLASCGVQTLRLNNAKHDLVVAKAAQIDPASKKTWQSEEVADRASLLTCQANEITLNGAIATQNASLTAHAQADAAALARAEAILKSAQGSAAATAKALTTLSAPIAAANAASRCAAFDKTFLGTLK